MSSITIEELLAAVEGVPQDYEVVMRMRHNYPISKAEGEKGWIAYVGGIEVNKEGKTIYLMNS